MACLSRCSSTDDDPVIDFATPGARQTVRSASSARPTSLTMPERMIFPPFTLTVMRLASISALRKNALSISCLRLLGSDSGLDLNQVCDPFDASHSKHCDFYVFSLIVPFDGAFESNPPLLNAQTDLLP